MAEAILDDRKRVLPCSTYLNGEYGLEDIYIGVPVVLGKDGVERIVQLELEPHEMDSLQGSAAFYKEQLASILGY
jgi:malate dehydrogenase